MRRLLGWDGPLGQAFGWTFARLIDVALIPVALWDSYQMAQRDDQWETDE